VCRNRRTVFPRFGCPRDKRITIKYTAREDDVVDIIFFDIASRSFYTQAAAFLSTDDVLSLSLRLPLSLTRSSRLFPPHPLEVVSHSLSLRARVVCLYLWSFSSTVAFVICRLPAMYRYQLHSVSLQPHIYIPVDPRRTGPV